MGARGFAMDLSSHTVVRTVSPVRNRSRILCSFWQNNREEEAEAEALRHESGLARALQQEEQTA